MPPPTDADRELSAEVAARFQIDVSPVFIRTLREQGVLVVIGGGHGSGGRHKLAHYKADAAEIVVGVARAKRDPDYARKFHRAVLIAWARDTPIGTQGLKAAFREHFRVERRTAKRIADGAQVRIGETVVGLNHATDVAIARARLGYRPSSEDLAAMETSTGPALHDSIWRSGLPGFLDLLPNDGKSLGFVARRADGTWRAEALGVEFWDRLALAPLERLTRTASRTELDMGRVKVRSGFRAVGLDCTDLVVATTAPVDCLHYQSEFGERWWESREWRRRIK
jgi:hypothetical protein